jgi:Hpt domain.
MIDPQDALRDAIARLRPRYLETMADFKARLDGAVRQAMRPAAGPQPLEDAQFVAHRIAGTAANFGWPELGELAMQTESALREHLSDRISRDTALTHIRDLSGALDRALHA